MTGAGPVCTFGDAVVDVIVEMTRALAPDDDVPVRTTLVAGGQAANVAAWVAALGGAASVITRLGDDAAGRLVRDALSGRGIDVRTPRRPGRTGTVVSLVAPDGSRTMASDRGDAIDLTPDDVAPEWFVGCVWLHLSGYTLLGGSPAAVALRAAACARAAGAAVSVDLSSATLVRHCGTREVQRRVKAAGAVIVFANRAEAAAAGALDVEQLVVKHGAEGAVLHRGGRTTAVPALPVAAVRDTTGAGDAFAAGWLVGGPALAAQAAARCVGTTGAMPT